MHKKNNNIDSYDIAKLKQNINRILDERNIDQIELARGTGIAQPRVSAALSDKNSQCFTVQQLVAISTYLRVPTDVLLGNNFCNTPDISLSDVMQKLFEINEIIPIHINNCVTNEEIPADAFSENNETTSKGICFKNPYLNKILEEWQELISHNSIGKHTQEKIMKLWKEDTLRENKNRLGKWDFRNKREEAYRMAHYRLNESWDLSMGEEVHILPQTKEEAELLEWYLEKYAVFDFEENEYCQLDNILSWLKDSIKTKENEESNELPF